MGTKPPRAFEIVNSDNRMHHFALLTEDEQRAAISRLAISGLGEYAIAAATGQAVEAVRAILGQRPGCQECDG